MAVLLDTGPLFAFYNDNDRDHRRAESLMDELVSGGHGAEIGRAHV